jgi:hypothetical protein
MDWYRLAQLGLGDTVSVSIPLNRWEAVLKDLLSANVRITVEKISPKTLMREVVDNDIGSAIALGLRPSAMRMLIHRKAESQKIPAHVELFVRDNDEFVRGEMDIDVAIGVIKKYGLR